MKPTSIAAAVVALVFAATAHASPCSGSAGGGPRSIQANAPGGSAVDGASAFPNPWRSDRHSSQPIRFQAGAGLQYVMVFTSSGRWVRTLHCTCAENFADWDLQNDVGQPVKSGFYMYLMRDVYGRQARGSLAVVR